MGTQDTTKLTRVKERERLGQHDPLEDSVFKVAENAQPASGNQEAAAGSKEKEKGGSVHTKEVSTDFTTAGQSYLCNTKKRIRCKQQAIKQGNKAVQMQRQKVTLRWLCITSQARILLCDPGQAQEFTHFIGCLFRAQSLLGSFLLGYPAPH